MSNASISNRELKVIISTSRSVSVKVFRISNRELKVPAQVRSVAGRDVQRHLK